eukprot:scaffold5297_cov104-Cylindrotheca_fusiformis.AAC.6
MEDIKQLSDGQEKVLAILPIPSAALSIMGSCIIISMALRRKNRRRWTPYTRLLIAMSMCDIVASATISIATFLRPRDTSSRVWAFGTDATCSAVGFMNQISFSAVLYNGMLSLYFLLTARFGFKNAQMARCIEPLMHIVSIGFPLVTAVTGSIIGVYGEAAAGLGCWVSDYGCDKDGDNCTSQIIAWLFYAKPALSVFICLIVNNSVIFLFVRRQTQAFSVSVSKMERTDSSTSPESIDGFSTRHENAVATEDRQNATENAASSILQHQNRRLALVSSQAFLFVASYFICNVWSGIMALAESAAKTETQELEMMVNFYPIAVLQAALLPLQGLLNMMVYIRPKYLKWRNQFPHQPTIWAVKYAIWGDESKFKSRAKTPSSPAKDQLKQPDQLNVSSSNKRLPQEMLSSLTASHGDFDHVVEKGTHDNRCDITICSHVPGQPAPTDSPKCFPTMKKSIARSTSSDLCSSVRDSVLGIISEHSESVFEPISTPNSRRLRKRPDTIVVCSASSDSRWTSGSCDIDVDSPPPPSRRKSAKSSRRQSLSRGSRRHDPIFLAGPSISRLDNILSETSTEDSPLRAPSRKPSPVTQSLAVEFQRWMGESQRSSGSTLSNASTEDSPLRPPSRKPSPVTQSLAVELQRWMGESQRSSNGTLPNASITEDSPLRPPSRKPSPVTQSLAVEIQRWVGESHCKLEDTPNGKWIGDKQHKKFQHPVPKQSLRWPAQA